MKRLLYTACSLGLALALTLGARASASVPSEEPACHHGTLAMVTDDPVPVDCPFCGGDPLLHAQRVNSIAFMSAKLAYRVLDASIF